MTINRLLDILKQNHFIETIVLFGKNCSNPKVLTFDNLMKGHKFNPSVNILENKVNKLEDVSFIMLSSGTTGLPKGVQLTQTNLLGTLDRVL